MSKIATLEIDESTALDLVHAMAMADTRREEDRDAFDEFQEQLREAFGWEEDQ